ncbi:MAG: excinuclease ABC subunit UvrC [Pseudomonadota bacterium]|nr:excinuclease ABC subunit UvrC [Pseudomonadota bacterium]MEC7830760.1 excinuclease ABC subunit UvrC [Pseudomonadota bacterium]MEC9382652.1 excinuclease ABC subunit UvrC [Pseudomonadota bacterium]
MKIGKDIINKTVKTIPNKPGVYRMLDENGEIIYIGKAKNLKKRVKSYSRKNLENKRIKRMAELIRSIEFTTTETEENALLLEVNLIKAHKPKYNILMRDDKSFPYIHFTNNELPSRIRKHRGKRKDKGDYFGPYAMEGSVYKVINILQKSFLLRTCSDSYYKNRTRPCLLFQIKKCSAPCTNEISITEYNKLLKEAKKFFKGDSKSIKSKFAKKMQNASKKQDYEEAAYYRDRIKSLSNLTNSFSINPKNLNNADVFSISKNEKYACIQVFFFRSKKNHGNKPFFIKNISGLAENEILQSFIPQFYSNKPSSKLILLSHKIIEKDLIQSTLSQQNNNKVQIKIPMRGERKEIISHALENSREALKKYTQDMLSTSKNLKNIQKTLELKETPNRIEVFDNSHIQGAFSTGAMIVATKEGFSKNNYRKFNIREAKTNDDYEMMYEVLYRRFLRLRNVPVKSEEFPDLVIVDGGKGQLSMAKKALKKAKLGNIAIIGISKGKNRNDSNEVIHLLNGDKKIIRRNDPTLFYIQRLRDEAHRFAIGTHRKKRERNIKYNPLDEIPGIGSKRKKGLLNAFGSAKGVKKAKIKELSEVDGISKLLAQNIYNWFNEVN